MHAHIHLTEPLKECYSLQNFPYNGHAVSEINFKFIVKAEDQGQRFDKVLAATIAEYSRSTLQEWIKKQWIKIDGLPAIGKQKVKGGETVEITACVEEVTRDQPQPMTLDILFEDEEVLVINKPAGLVVHPGAGIPSGTLLNALLHHHASLNQLPRAGIVHRLDKETSGVMMIAKTPLAYQSLVAQLANRTVSKKYQALVRGEIIAGGTIENEMARHPQNRTKMAVVPEGKGKPAISHYRVLGRYGSYTHLQVTIETGRTHQIRVHMAAIGHPIIGDATYGGRLNFPRGLSEEKRQAILKIRRQMLHAWQLSFSHPKTEEVLSVEAPLPIDFENLLSILAIEEG